MKKLLAMLLAVAMLLSLAACGAKEEPAETAAPQVEAPVSGEETPEQVTIRITWWGGQGRHDYTQQLLDLYTEQNPHVRFEATPSGWDGYFEKLATDTATGGMPDIFQMDYLYISTYANNNSLADLTPYFEDGTIDTTYIDDTILATGNVNGVQVGMPVSTSVLMVAYAPEVLAAAGVETPTSDWTWEDFAAMTQKVYDELGYVGTSSGPAEDVNVFNYWVRSHGATLFAADNKSLGFEDDAITAEFFQTWKDMMDTGAAPDPDEYAQISSLGNEAGPMSTNETGFHFGWNNYTTQLAASNPTLKMVTPPKGDSNGLWIKPGMFFSVAETSQVKDECAKFIDWIMNSEEANAIMMGERGTPASSAIREYLVGTGKMSEQQKDMFAYVDTAVSLCGPNLPPDPAGISEVNTAFRDAAYSVFYGQASAEEAAATFREEANAILESNN